MFKGRTIFMRRRLKYNYKDSNPDRGKKRSILGKEGNYIKAPYIWEEYKDNDLLFATLGRYSIHWRSVESPRR